MWDFDGLRVEVHNPYGVNFNFLKEFWEMLKEFF